MPALKPVTDVVRIRLIGTDSGYGPLGSHFTMSYSGAAPTSAQLATFATAIGSAWTANLAPLAGATYTLTTVEVIDLTSSTSAFIDQAMSHAGTRAGPVLPLSTCFSLRFLTNLRRRGGRWHAQLRFGTQTDIGTASLWTTAFVTAVETGWQAFITAVDAAVWSGGGSLAHVGVQYFGPPNRTVTNSAGRVHTVSTPLAVPAVYPITGYGAGQKLGSQRKRLLASGA